MFTFLRLFIRTSVSQSFPRKSLLFQESNNIFSKCGQIRRKLRIWSHLLKKSFESRKSKLFCEKLWETLVFINRDKKVSKNLKLQSIVIVIIIVIIMDVVVIVRYS